LKVGEIADIIIVDPVNYRNVDICRFQSRSVNSPYIGRFLRGWPTYTIYKGNLVFDRNLGRMDRV
jgi:dihydroorotase-like cyclic amidohydrolase